MYNNILYNNQFYNGQGTTSGTAQQDNIVFNGLSLQDSVVSSSLMPKHNFTMRDLPLNKIPRNDGEFIVGDFWRQKVIVVSGIVKESTTSLLNTKITAMKTLLAVREANLDIK